MSRNHDFSFGNQLLTVERIYETMKNVFGDNNWLPEVSRSYAGHHQIYCAIIEQKGNNNYLTERKGASFWVRSRFVTTLEGGGMVVLLDPLSGGES